MARLLSPLLLAACLAPAGLRAEAAERPTADEAVLHAAGVPADGAGLLAFLRSRAKGASADEVAALTARLGAPTAVGRARAAAELVGIGPDAVPALRALAGDADARGSAAARRCLRVLEVDSGGLTGAVLRLTALRRPDGAAAVLLAFLPHAEDDGVVEEAVAALATVATHDGKPDASVLQALDDPVALRRSAAVDVLSRCAPALLPEARKLLADPVPVVRLRTALALARVHEPKAVSTLIALLAELPLQQAAQAEEFLSTLAAEQSPKVTLGEDNAARARCRDAWAEWWRGTEDSARALGELRKRSRGDSDRERVLELIRGLGDDSFDVRQKATRGLKEMGSGIAPMLRQAANNPDLEVRQRVQTLLQEIDKETAPPLSFSVPRCLALRKPEGSCEALLAYLPFAEDEGTVAEVQEALDAVAFRDGKPEPALVKALGDKSAVRRAAAGEALCPAAAPELRDAVRKLLDDPDPSVRVKVALALAANHDRTAVPALIALACGQPGAAASAAEDYLARLAGDQLPPAVAAAGQGDASPRMPPAADGTGAPVDPAEAARGRRREAWSAWWRASGPGVELIGRSAVALSTQRFLGYTLLVEGQNGVVREVDAAGKSRWQLTGLNSPQDAQVLPGDHVLVAESGSQRITERNLKGEILWQHATGNFPISARRLPNGHTFVVTRNRIFEVDRAGRETFAVSRPRNDVMSARRLRDGRVAMISNQSALVFLDPSGHELKSVRLQGVSNWGNDLLPKGGAVVPLSWQNKVMEYDADGKIVWEASVPQPMSAFRLPNGNTLVSVQQWPPKVIELDRQGKQVAETAATNYVQRATRR
jgi:HEAT repeat protein